MRNLSVLKKTKLGTPYVFFCFFFLLIQVFSQSTRKYDKFPIHLLRFCQSGVVFHRCRSLEAIKNNDPPRHPRKTSVSEFPGIHNFPFNTEGEWFFFNMYNDKGRIGEFKFVGDERVSFFFLMFYFNKNVVAL